MLRHVLKLVGDDDDGFYWSSACSLSFSFVVPIHGLGSPIMARLPTISNRGCDLRSMDTDFNNKIPLFLNEITGK